MPEIIITLRRKYWKYLCQLLLASVMTFHYTICMADDSFESALKAYENNDYSTASRVFQRLADQGQSLSQRYLGEMYDKGLGVPQDYATAVNWYRKAAIQKDSQAQFLLGVKYLNGHGVVENPVEAYTWFALAFNNGYVKAADPLRVLNKSLSTMDRQIALKRAAEMINQLSQKPALSAEK